MTSTTIEVTHLEEIVGDHPICCDYADDEFNASDFLCSKEPAKWVLVLVRCATCHMGGARLACDTCKDIRLSSEGGVVCDCGEVTVPARAAYSRIEAL